MKVILLVLIIWLICGILTYGITFAYMQEEYPLVAEIGYEADRNFAILLGICGPIGLLVSFFRSGFAKHGLKFK